MTQPLPPSSITSILTADDIFSADVPLLLRIPGDIRAVFSREFSTLAGNAVFWLREDADSMAVERAWRKMFFFWIAILYKPVKKLKRRTGAQGLVLKRLNLWARREFKEL